MVKYLRPTKGPTWISHQYTYWSYRPFKGMEPNFNLILLKKDWHIMLIEWMMIKEPLRIISLLFFAFLFPQYWTKCKVWGRISFSKKWVIDMNSSLWSAYRLWHKDLLKFGKFFPETLLIFALDNWIRLVLSPFATMINSLYWKVILFDTK